MVPSGIRSTRRPRIGGIRCFLCVAAGTAAALALLFFSASPLLAESAQLHNNAGLAYYYQGRDDLAYDEFVRALEKDASLASPRYNLGRLFERQGRFDEALEQYRDALQLDPTMIEALRAVERLQGEDTPEPSVSSVSSGRTPDSELAKEAAAIQRSYDGGDKKAARKRLARLLRANPDSLPLLLLKATFDERRGNISGAIRALQLAGKVSPNSADIALRQAQLLYRAGLFDQAVQEADRASGLNPALAAPYRILGLVSLTKQKPVEANAYFLEATRLDPNDTVSRAQVMKLSKQLGLLHYNAGLYYFQQQDWARSKDELEQAIALGNLAPEQSALAQQYLVIAEFSAARVAEQIGKLQSDRRNEQIGRISKQVRYPEVETSPNIWKQGRHVAYEGFVVSAQPTRDGGSEILVTRNETEFLIGEREAGGNGRFDQSFRSNTEMENWFRVVTPTKLPNDPRIRPTSRIRVEGQLGRPKTVRNPYNRGFSRRPLPTVEATYLEIRREQRLERRASISLQRDVRGRDSSTQRNPLRSSFPTPRVDTAPGLAGPLKIDYLALPAEPGSVFDG